MDAKQLAFERSVDYKPYDYTLSPQEYYQEGFQRGYEEGLRQIEKHVKEFNFERNGVVENRRRDKAS